MHSNAQTISHDACEGLQFHERPGWTPVALYELDKQGLTQLTYIHATKQISDSTFDKRAVYIVHIERFLSCTQGLVSDRPQSHPPPQTFSLELHRIIYYILREHMLTKLCNSNVRCLPALPVVRPGITSDEYLRHPHFRNPTPDGNHVMNNDVTRQTFTELRNPNVQHLQALPLIHPGSYARPAPKPRPSPTLFPDWIHLMYYIINMSTFT